MQQNQELQERTSRQGFLSLVVLGQFCIPLVPAYTFSIGYGIGHRDLLPVATWADTENLGVQTVIVTSCKILRPAIMVLFLVPYSSWSLSSQHVGLGIQIMKVCSYAICVILGTLLLVPYSKLKFEFSQL